MKIRGERECTECGTRWSYYETGSVGCPACGSLRSVGIDDRTHHTDLPIEFDLTAVRAEIDDLSADELAERARDACREYVHRRGFVRGGTIEPIDDTYLGAIELMHVADVVSRAGPRTLDDREELYLLELLRDADDGERPAREDVPASLRAARGLAYANAVREFRRDVRTWAEERDLGPDERGVLERLDSHVTRVRMLDGDVERGAAETLVEAARDLATALEADDEDALARVRERLDRLE